MAHMPDYVALGRMEQGDPSIWGLTEADGTSLKAIPGQTVVGKLPPWQQLFRDKSVLLAEVTCVFFLQMDNIRSGMFEGYKLLEKIGGEP